MKQKTSDIVLAAYLKIQGFNLENISVVGKQGAFTFTDVDPEVVNQYFLGNASVEPVTFNQMIRQLTTACKRMSPNE